MPKIKKEDLEDLEGKEVPEVLSEEEEKKVKDGPGPEPPPADRKRKEKRVELQVDLRYYFTDDEIRDLGMEVAKKEIHKNDLEDNLKSLGSDYRSKILEDKLIIKDRSMKIKNGFEFRRTECYKLLDYGVGIVSIFRKDNGVLIEERPMTDAEKQVPLI